MNPRSLSKKDERRMPSPRAAVALLLRCHRHLASSAHAHRSVAPGGQLPALHVSAHHWSVAPAVLSLHVKAALWPHWHMLSGQWPVEHVRTHHWSVAPGPTLLQALYSPNAGAAAAAAGAGAAAA